MAGTYIPTTESSMIGHGMLSRFHAGDLHNLTISATDGSHAHVTSEGELIQSGPRRIWDDIETVHQTWRSLGTPPRERFGLTVTPQRQLIWLDKPDSRHRWPVG